MFGGNLLWRYLLKYKYLSNSFQILRNPTNTNSTLTEKQLFYITSFIHIQHTRKVMLNSHIKTNFNTYTSNHRVKTSCNSNPIASFVIEARLGLHSCHIIRNIKGIQLLMRNPSAN